MCYESVLTVCIVPQVCSDGSAFQSGVFPPCTSGKPKCEDDTVKPTCADGQVERNNRVLAIYWLRHGNGIDLLYNSVITELWPDN